MLKTLPAMPFLAFSPSWKGCLSQKQEITCLGNLRLLAFVRVTLKVQRLQRVP